LSSSPPSTVGQKALISFNESMLTIKTIFDHQSTQVSGLTPAHCKKYIIFWGRDTCVALSLSTLGWCRQREKIDWQEARKFDCRLVRTIFIFCCPYFDQKIKFNLKRSERRARKGRERNEISFVAPAVPLSGLFFNSKTPARDERDGLGRSGFPGGRLLLHPAAGAVLWKPAPGHAAMLHQHGTEGPSPLPCKRVCRRALPCQRLWCVIF